MTGTEQIDAVSEHSMPHVATRWKVFDWVATGIAGIGLAIAVGLTQAQAHFAALLSDFGGKLPTLTFFCLKPWAPFAFWMISAVVVVDGYRRNARVGSVKGRLSRIMIVGALTAALPIVFLVGMYLSVFAVAAAIK